MSLPSKVPSLAETLERIRIHTNTPHTEWLDQLKVTEDDYSDIASGLASPSAMMIERLASKFNLSFENLFNGRIDFSALVSLSGNAQNVLPERYRVGAESRVRTSKHLLSYIEKFYGWKVRQRILRHFQIEESLFLDSDNLINIVFLKDLCEWIIQNNGGNELLHSMGQYSVFANRRTPLGEMLSTFKSSVELYENVFDHIVKTHFDQNSVYWIQKLSEKGCTLKVVPKTDVLDRIQPVLRKGEKRMGSEWVCRARSGSYSSLSGYINQPFSHVRETRCIHHGDSHCLYVFEFSDYSQQTALSQ